MLALLALGREFSINLTVFRRIFSGSEIKQINEFM